MEEDAGNHSKEDTKQGIIMQLMEDSDDDVALAKMKKPAVKREAESGGEGERDDDIQPLKNMKRPSLKDTKCVENEEKSAQKKKMTTARESGGEEGVEVVGAGQPAS